MNMKLPVVVTPLSIYHGCSNRKTFWEGNLTPDEFTPVNMKKVAITKNDYNYITLDISFKCGSLENMEITSLEPKDYLVRSREGSITSLGIKTIVRSKKKKNSRYDINNVSMKDISNMMKDSEKFPYKGYVWKRPKHEPTGNYFYISKQLAKCMMIPDALNLHVDPVIT